MDPPPPPPSFHHLHHHHHNNQHHRYVPHPPSFPDSYPDNFFPHHRLPPTPLPPPPHHHLPPPPSLPPPPRPPPQHFTFHHNHRPPPPSLDDHQSQISNFIPPHLLSSPPPPPPRVSSSHRDEGNTNFNSNYHHHRHYWVEPPPRARVLPDQPFPPALPQPPLRPPPSLDNTYHPDLDFRPDFDRFAYNDRFLDERYGDDRFIYNSNGNPDITVVNPDEERRWGRKDLDFDIIDDDEKYSLAPGDRYRNVCCFDENLSGEYMPNLGNYEVYDERDGDPRRDSFSPRNGGMETDSGYGSPSRELLRDSFHPGRFRDNDLVREDRQGFFIRSPKKKQVQKKSALLRIRLGKGTKSNGNRNKVHESTQHSRGNFDESLSAGAGLWGKEKDGLVRAGCKMEEKREKSPVELDVSFKSNSLVAKAIVTPSSPAVDSDRNSTPRKRKIRKISLSSSPLTKLSEDSSKASSSANEMDGPSNSGKSCKQSSDNIVFADRSTSGSSLQPYSSLSNEMPENVTATVSPTKVSSGGGNSAGAIGTPFRRIRKRKIVMASPVRESVLQPVKDADELAKVDKSTDNLTTVHQLDEGMKHPWQSDASADEGMKHPWHSDASADVVSIHGIALAQYSNEAISDKVNQSAECMLSEKNDSDIDCSTPFSAAFSNSSCPNNTNISNRKMDMVINDGADQAEISNHNCDSMSNIDTSSVLQRPKSTLSGRDRLVEFTQHTCMDALALPENALRSGSLELAVSVEDHPTSCLSKATEIGLSVVHPAINTMNFGDQTELYALENAKYTSTDASAQCSQKTEGIAVDDEGSSDAAPKKLLVNKTGECPENDIPENASRLSCTGHSLDTIGVIISSSTACRDKGSVSDPCFPYDDATRQSSFDHSMVPLENGADKACTRGVVSVGTIEDYNAKVERKRKATEGQLSLCSGVNDVPANEDSSINGQHAGLISLVTDVSAAKAIACPDKEDDTLNRGNLGGGPLKVRVLDQDAFGIDANVASPMCGKKRKCDQWPDTVDGFTLRTDVCSSIGMSTSESEGRTAVTSADLLSCLMPTSPLFENSTTGALLQADSTGDGVSQKSKKLELIASCTTQSGADPEKHADLVIYLTKNQLDKVDVVSQGDANQLTDMEMGDRAPGRDRECSDAQPVKDSLESVLNHTSLRDREGPSAVNFAGELADSFSDSLSRMGSPENLSVKSHSEIDDSKTSVCQNDKKLHKWPLSASDSELDRRVGQSVVRKPPTSVKAASSLSKGTSKVTQNLNSVWVKSNLSKNHLSSSVPQVFSGRPSLNFVASRKAVTLNHIAKPRTWHRTTEPSVSAKGSANQLNPVPRCNYTQKKFGTLPSSYIRKGNSLVRNPSPIATASNGVYASTSVYRFNSSDIDTLKKGWESESISQISTVLGGPIAVSERPQTPPLCSSSKLLSNSAPSSNDSTSLPGAEPPESSSPVATSGPMEFTTNMNLLKCSEDVSKSSAPPECQTGSVKNCESQSVVGERNSGKKITYVKRRSNQLVASLGAGDVSDGYYKRKKNQLIRTLLENNIQECVVAADDSQKHRNQKFKLSGNSKTYKPLKFSLVWTLREPKSSKSDGNSVPCLKAWPYLFPWKRATYWRNSMSFPKDASLSLISRKLLLSRKRETIYTRSVNGFSLRRSKVLSVGGPNLKWSKSIERNSKKANKEATLAVAAAEKSKKEQKVAVSTALNRRNNVSRKSVYCIKLRPGERIFRIGSERYKMDPTRNTLHRITNDENKLCPVPQPQESAKKSYVPRRLMIGNDEYVRVGNGNKLVRDPKKRTRTLASEKVRWSLHTVRLRLAKRRKYCQFFTRFGKCNKDDGKCPYIHDSSKIAVCTKFLNGSCSNPNCKLTHEVIPERMPDCSYFLLGLCLYENCPYRHVNVNPSASTCDGFLRGYCADGNECRKKHTYVCPVFEATGVCPQGSKCKLHHPKKRKGTRKPLREQKYARGRYFGSSHLMVDSRIAGSEKFSESSKDSNFSPDGIFGDYVSLDNMDEEVKQAVDLTTKRISDPGSSDAQVPTVDELIKPLRLLNKYPMTDSSPTIDSTSDVASADMLRDSNCSR